MLDSSMFILIDFDTFYISNEIHIKNEPVVSHLRVELTTDCQNALKSSPSKTVFDEFTTSNLKNFIKDSNNNIILGVQSVPYR